MLNRRAWVQYSAAVAAVACMASTPLVASAADMAPDAMIKQLSDQVLNTLKTDQSIRGGDVTKITSYVDSVVMPNVDFRRMMASAVGPKWRTATAAQQQQLQDEFKKLMVNTYSGALHQVSDQTINVKPVRMQAGDKEVVVRSEILGRGDPIQLDYRLEKTPGQGMGWKIYNLNVMGIWMVETYRNQFQEELNKPGGSPQTLIDSIVARNKANAGGAKK
ncbi:ABC transporter substrate-binding protein [Comamonas sp. JUb58]|uniref:MlaC/ttg2D family ABC transporter substrate-binding protein n=1 Tax=Comamonas sp. JUb58 TaxID=2485114 RepID=UPI0010619775|nr:ABC transporter substrate-binding protein [Comamonas sp. JUb58]TDS79313.1 phospholipid transport system substrate-binding protein [Comamonas sp. JUb58]